jgi:hypothetical protein
VDSGQSKTQALQLRSARHAIRVVLNVVKDLCCSCVGESEVGRLRSPKPPTQILRRKERSSHRPGVLRENDTVERDKTLAPAGRSRSTCPGAKRSGCRRRQGEGCGPVAATRIATTGLLVRASCPCQATQHACGQGTPRQLETAAAGRVLSSRSRRVFTDVCLLIPVYRLLSIAQHPREARSRVDCQPTTVNCQLSTALKP